MEELRVKLNDMFDMQSARVEKTQYCPVGRWLFPIFVTLFAVAVYGVLLWGALWASDGLDIFLTVLLSCALGWVLFRAWFCFAVDLLSQRFAESTVFIRKGDERYYHTKGRFIEKFEYAGGYLCVSGKSYDKFFDKSDYSPLAGRLNKSLQRRSALYTTFTPAFWFDLLRDAAVTVTDEGIDARFAGGRVALSCGEDGKLSRICYTGNGYYLYDSVSPLKIFDGKIPGKYKITYTITPCDAEEIVLNPIFYEAMKDFLMPLPHESFIRGINADKGGNEDGR